MRYCFENKSKNIHWESFDIPGDAPLIATLGVLDYARGLRDTTPFPTSEAHDDCFELHYVDRGLQTFQVGAAIVPLHAGELFMAHPGQAHRPLYGIVSPSRIYWARFPADVSKGFTPAEARWITRRWRQISGQACVGSKALIKSLLDGLLEILKTPRPAPMQRLALEKLSSALLVALGQVTPLKNRAPRHPVFIEKVCRAIRSIHDAPACARHVPEMARACGICETLFRGLFKEITGLTPIDYLHCVRIERAKALLSQGIAPTTIAYELGYSSAPRFPGGRAARPPSIATIWTAR